MAKVQFCQRRRESRPPVPQAAHSDDEEGLVRTNEAHNWLQRLGSHLRRFIDSEITGAFGADWLRHQLPSNKYDEWKSKKGAASRAGALSRPLIAYADFTDYVLVICKRDNWEQVLSPFFERENRGNNPSNWVAGKVLRWSRALP